MLNTAVTTPMASASKITVTSPVVRRRSTLLHTTLISATVRRIWSTAYKRTTLAALCECNVDGAKRDERAAAITSHC